MQFLKLILNIFAHVSENAEHQNSYSGLSCQDDEVAISKFRIFYILFSSIFIVYLLLGGTSEMECETQIQ